MTQTLLALIKFGGDISKFNGPRNGLIAASPWIEMRFPIVEEDGTLRAPSLDEEREIFSKLAAPRVFKQHVKWCEVAQSPDAEIQKSLKYVAITRSLYDLPNSLYNHMMNHNPAFFEYTQTPCPPPDMRAFVDLCINVFFDWGYMRGLYERRNDENLLTITFEELTKDTFGTAKKLIKYLEWEPVSIFFAEKY